MSTDGFLTVTADCNQLLFLGGSADLDRVDRAVLGVLVRVDHVVDSRDRSGLQGLLDVDSLLRQDVERRVELQGLVGPERLVELDDPATQGGLEDLVAALALAGDQDDREVGGGAHHLRGALLDGAPTPRGDLLDVLQSDLDDLHRERLAGGFLEFHCSSFESMSVARDELFDLVDVKPQALTVTGELYLDHVLLFAGRLDESRFAFPATIGDSNPLVERVRDRHGFQLSIFGV